MTSSFPPGDPQGPEYLEQGSGRRLVTGPTDPAKRRRALVAGAAVAGLALVGGGVWAAVSFFGTGPQPAEALPDSTLGYASIDLDPSGGQKIEAIKMLRKFPAIEDEIDLDTDDDLREKLFTELGLDDECEGLDYQDDIEPWLGDRAAVAAIDLGEEQPTFAGVLQVKDAAAAEEGLAKIRACGSGDGGFSIEGEWAVVAETGSIADQVVAETAKGSLADDPQYQKWTDEVGDAGVVNLYAAPEAGRYFAESVGNIFALSGYAGTAGTDSATSCAYDSTMSPEEMDEAMAECEDSLGHSLAMPEPEVPDELTEALEDFDGLAVALRFDDGGLELEFAGDAGLAESALPDSDGADDVLSTLPEDTAVAVGVGFVDGWFGDVLDTMVELSGAGSVDELIAEAEAETGLELPDDVETLAGESAALAIGSDFDVEEMVNSSDASGIPIGVKIKGDPAAIEEVLDKLRAQMPAGEVELVSESDGDIVAVGPDAFYVSSLVDDGGLGDVEAFRDVVDEAEDAGAIVFVNFDAGDWLASAAEGDETVEENLRPLEAFGISAWREDDAAHAVLRLTTND